MEQSESIKELATALSAAQGEMPAAPFNSVNPFLKNRFADLGSIIATAQPVLAKHGLSVSQFPVSEGGNVGVITQLMHNSGEWMRSMVSLPLLEEKGKSIPQAGGSIITYLRRYSYAAVLGMYTEEDADGGVSPKKATVKSEPPAEPVSSVTKGAGTGAQKLKDFEAKYNISQESILGALGTKSVGEWLKLHPGTKVDDALTEVVAVMGLEVKPTAATEEDEIPF